MLTRFHNLSEINWNGHRIQVAGQMQPLLFPLVTVFVVTVDEGETFSSSSTQCFGFADQVPFTIQSYRGGDQGVVDLRTAKGCLPAAIARITIEGQCVGELHVPIRGFWRCLLLLFLVAAILMWMLS